jgi:hypothetical protein
MRKGAENGNKKRTGLISTSEAPVKYKTSFQSCHSGHLHHHLRGKHDFAHIDGSIEPETGAEGAKDAVRKNGHARFVSLERIQNTKTANAEKFALSC